jgi:hypothetical protein
MQQRARVLNTFLPNSMHSSEQMQQREAHVVDRIRAGARREQRAHNVGRASKRGPAASSLPAGGAASSPTAVRILSKAPRRYGSHDFHDGARNTFRRKYIARVYTSLADRRFKRCTKSFFTFFLLSA